MSREWSRDSFTPAGVAPVGFVPHGLFAGAAALAPHSLSEVVQARRTGFAPLEAAPRRDGGFMAATSFTPLREAVVEPVIVPEPPAPERAVVELVAEPVVAEVLPPVDTDAIYAEGLAEGRRLAMAEAAADAAACAKLISGLGAGGSRFDRGALATRLRQTVLMLVGQLVGETGIAAEKLADRIDGAVDMLADVTEPARIHLNPADAALMQGHLSPNLAAVPDPKIERGGFRLETMSAIIEDGPALWLDQLASALDRVAVPAA